MQEIATLIIMTGWVGAWFMWLVGAGSLQRIFARTAPEKWLAGRDRSEFGCMSEDDFVIFLCAESDTPLLLRKHLTCHYCLAASGSLVGYLILRPGWSLGPGVLLWASGAFFGHLLYKKL